MMASTLLDGSHVRLGLGGGLGGWLLGVEE
jgi:hypothetical protein